MFAAVNKVIFVVVLMEIKEMICSPPPGTVVDEINVGIHYFIVRLNLTLHHDPHKSLICFASGHSITARK